MIEAIIEAGSALSFPAISKAVPCAGDVRIIGSPIVKLTSCVKYKVLISGMSYDDFCHFYLFLDEEDAKRFVDVIKERDSDLIEYIGIEMMDDESHSILTWK